MRQYCAIRILGVVALAANLAACAALPWNRTATGDPAAGREGMTHTTLPNGLDVVVVEDHSAPVAALMVWVRVGSGEEHPEQAGMAHVFEHMLFKGTERFGVGEIASTVEAAGGNINAFTSFDVTAYHITMASRDVSVGIDVLSDAVQHSTFDPGELAREEEVVVEEIRRSEDSPGRLLAQTLFSTAYTAHPYRLPVIGTEESVKSFTREGLLDFYRTWYVPNNMTFIVVGDVDPGEVVAQIGARFEGATARDDLAHPRVPEPEQAQARARVVHSEFEQTLLGIAWPATGFADADTPYLDLLAGILGGGEASRLYRNIKDRDQLVHAISASAYTPKDPGVFMIDAFLEADQIEATLGAIAAEVARARDSGPSQVELERARVNLLASEVHERETMQGQARKIGYYEAMGSGLAAEQRYMDALRGASADDVQRVAREYLRPERANVINVLARGERPDLEAAALLAALDAGAGKRVAASERAELRPGIYRYTLPNGLRIVVKPNDNVPLVALRLSMLGGLLAESEDTQGITSFLAEMLERGTEQRSSAQIAAETENIAGTLSGFSGRNSFGVSADFLADSLDSGLELFVDVALHPAFAPDEIEKLRRERVAALARREDNLAAKTFEILNKALYGDHPYGFVTLGTEESLAAIDSAALRAYFDRYAHPSNAVLSAVGDVDPDDIVARLGASLGEWSGPDEVALPDNPVPPAPTAPEEVSLEKGKAQTHVVLGFRGLTLDDPDLPALDVLTQILAGQGGRLFLELRDRQSLAYSVTAFSIEGLAPGVFGAYIAGAPDKLEQSVAGLENELRKLLDGPIHPDELERARNYLIGSQAVGMQRYGSQASLLSLDELYGLGATHHMGYRERVEAVTLEDVARVAQRIIRLDRPVVAIVK